MNGIAIEFSKYQEKISRRANEQNNKLRYLKDIDSILSILLNVILSKVGEYENSKYHWETIICYHEYPIQEEQQSQIHEQVKSQVEDVNEESKVPQREEQDSTIEIMVQDEVEQVHQDSTIEATDEDMRKILSSEPLSSSMNDF